MTKRDSGLIAPTILVIVCIALVLASAIGWGWNIVKIFQADAFSGEIVARVLGVVIPPVGAVMGWM